MAKALAVCTGLGFWGLLGVFGLFSGWFWCLFGSFGGGFRGNCSYLTAQKMGSALVQVVALICNVLGGVFQQ